MKKSYNKKPQKQVIENEEIEIKATFQQGLKEPKIDKSKLTFDFQGKPTGESYEAFSRNKPEVKIHKVKNAPQDPQPQKEKLKTNQGKQNKMLKNLENINDKNEKFEMPVEDREMKMARNVEHGGEGSEIHMSEIITIEGGKTKEQMEMEEKIELKVVDDKIMKELKKKSEEKEELIRQQLEKNFKEIQNTLPKNQQAKIIPEQKIEQNTVIQQPSKFYSPLAKVENLQQEQQYNKIQNIPLQFKNDEKIQNQFQNQGLQNQKTSQVQRSISQNKAYEIINQSPQVINQNTQQSKNYQFQQTQFKPLEQNKKNSLTTQGQNLNAFQQNQGDVNKNFNLPINQNFQNFQRPSQTFVKSIPQQSIQVQQYQPKQSIQVQQYQPSQSIQVQQYQPSQLIQVQQYQPKQSIQVQSFQPNQQIQVQSFQPNRPILVQNTPGYAQVISNLQNSQKRSISIETPKNRGSVWVNHNYQ